MVCYRSRSVVVSGVTMLCAVSEVMVCGVWSHCVVYKATGAVTGVMGIVCLRPQVKGCGV